MIYAMSDFHLSNFKPKPMDVFDPIWKEHQEKIKNNWPLIETDTIIMPGDLSWAATEEELIPDLEMINAFPGKKILLKGNHDIWWDSSAKLNKLLEPYESITFIHNNSIEVEGISICGTKGADFEKPENYNEKLVQREYMRLQRSLDAATSKKKIVFTHFPFQTNQQYLELLKQYNVQQAYFGHIHGTKIEHIQTGLINGIEFHVIAADQLGFIPILI